MVRLWKGLDSGLRRNDGDDVKGCIEGRQFRLRRNDGDFVNERVCA